MGIERTGHNTAAAIEVSMSRFSFGVQDLASWQKSPGALVTDASPRHTLMKH